MSQNLDQMKKEVLRFSTIIFEYIEPWLMKYLCPACL